MGSFRDFKKENVTYMLLVLNQLKVKMTLFVVMNQAYSVESAEKKALKLLTELNLKLPTDYRNVSVVIRKVDFSI